MMYRLIPLFLLIGMISCQQDGGSNSQETEIEKVDQKNLNNENLKTYKFLDCMYSDSYFPSFLVDKCQQVLVRFCFKIESESPKDNEALYVLSHEATEEINALQNEFFENGSEIESVARDCFALNFEYIASAYGYAANVEELIGNREW